MNTHVEIRRPAFSKFMKAEVAEFASKTIGIVENYEPETLLLTPVFNPLVALKPEIQLLSLRYGIDSERAKVDTLKSKLMLTISNLKLQARLISKTDSDEGLYVIKNHINTYLRRLNATKNDKVMTQQVEGFLKTVNEDEAFAEALDEHDLSMHVFAIREALEELRGAMSKRVTLLAKRPKIATKDITAKVANAVHNLLKGIEVAQIMNTELDYEGLIDEMNELVNGFRLSVRLRIANNRRKAEQEKESMPDEESNEMETTSTRSYNGFAPYSLSIEPEADEDESWDDWDESYEDDLDDEIEGDMEHVEETVESGEEGQ